MAVATFAGGIVLGALRVYSGNVLALGARPRGLRLHGVRRRRPRALVGVDLMRADRRRGASIAVAARRTARARREPRAAAQTDEIQVYDGSLAAVHEFTLTLHTNYVITGNASPAFPGAVVANHSLNGVPEFAYGVTDWFEAGLYLPRLERRRARADSATMASSCARSSRRRMATTGSSRTA